MNFIREPGASLAPRSACGGSGAAQVSAANRSGAKAAVAENSAAVTKLRAGYAVFPPYTILGPNEDAPQGFSIDLVLRIAKLTDPPLPIEWHRYNFHTMQKDLASGRFDFAADPVLPRMELEFTGPGVSITSRSPFHELTERTERTQAATFFRRPEGDDRPTPSGRQGAGQRLGGRVPDSAQLDLPMGQTGARPSRTGLPAVARANTAGSGRIGTSHISGPCFSSKSRFTR